MNKADLINAVAQESGLTKKDSEAAIDALISVVTESLAKEEKVVLVGFGTFETKNRAERKGRNPQTKEAITIPASKAPVFKAGKSLKDKVNA
ncbi:MAG TPA: integration host factor subunit alpha [Ruminiclostridium sp.]|nr:integration host factor subunit alpha [Ruminiclostridium sp.]